MENTDFVIEHIDEEVQVIADQPSVVTNYPANTDFFIENIDSNVISIAHSLNIEASEVNFRPANTDFFIENIDKNVIAIAESMNLSPSEVDFRPANTDLFVENIDKNLIKIAESLSLTPYEVTIRPANTDMFIENIDKNVTLIKGSTNVVTVSGEYININLPDGGKVQSAQLNGNATQTTYSGKNKMPMADADMTGEGEGNRNKTFRMALPAGTYTVSFDLDSFELGTNTAFGVYMQIYASSATALIDLAIINITSTTATGRKRITFTINEDGTTDRSDNVRIALTNWDNGARAKISNIQIESGSTATSYEPFVGGIPAPNPSYPQPISVVTGENVVKVVGKNLFDNTQQPIFVNSAKAETIDTGVRVSPLSQGAYRYTAFKVLDVSQHVGETITLSLDISYSSANDGYAYIGLADAAGGNRLPKVRISESGSYSYTIEQDEERPYVVVVLYASYSQSTQVGGYSDYTNIQLELGSATDYEPYQEQNYPISLGDNYLAKIPNTDYQDKLVKVDGTWYTRRMVGRVVLDGSESWAYVTSNDGYFQTSYSIQNIIPFDGSNALCTHFKPLTRYSVVTGKVNLTINLNGSYCAIRYQAYTDADTFKSWLSTHPTTVYYALATPTTTEITNQTLIDQLEALASATLNQGVNNIFIEIATGNAMPTLELVIEKY